MKEDVLKPCKYINDPVYGGIPLTELEVSLLDTAVFQRLRGLKQLARVNYVFPGADHSRFSHSLGVLYIMGLMTDFLYRRGKLAVDDVVKLRAAALLHDIGHYPLSHLGESVYGFFKDNENADGALDSVNDGDKLYLLASYHSKSAHHEHLGAYIVQHNEQIKEILGKYSLEAEEIADIFTGKMGSKNNVYSQLLHSSLDADRLDYMLRDSYQTGVKYGLVDLQYLVRLLDIVPYKNKNVLVFNKKGQHVVEHFLMARYFHYSQIIYHKTNMAFEGLVKCLYIKLLQQNRFIYNKLEDIHNGVNNPAFLNFKDAFLETALESYYHETEDAAYKQLYEMYLNRIRPKVIYEKKDLYEKEPSTQFSLLKRILKKEPEKITGCIGHERWGFNITPLTLEPVHPFYSFANRETVSDGALIESVKLYDKNKTGDEAISYLGADTLSVIGKLSGYTSEFIRIYVFDKETDDKKWDEIRRKIDELLAE